MNQKEILALLESVRVIITDSHIVYTSGNHGTAYVNKDALYPHTAHTSCLCRLMAEKYADSNVEIVIAPAIGGVVLSQWVAYHLSSLSGREVLAIYAEKNVTGEFAVRRGYDTFIVGKRVLVVEDVLTTGGSAKQVVQITRRLGGELVGLAVLCNRGDITLQDVGNVPKLTALINIQMEVWEAQECPLCARGVPINTSIGKGHEFLAAKKL